MSERLKAAGWAIAFVALCAFWTHEVIVASRKPQRPTDAWICPIMGQCGPAGTPGLGRW